MNGFHCSLALHNGGEGLYCQSGLTGEVTYNTCAHVGHCLNVCGTASLCQIGKYGYCTVQYSMEGSTCTCRGCADSIFLSREDCTVSFFISRGGCTDSIFLNHKGCVDSILLSCRGCTDYIFLSH